ncbi:MAG: ABC transporter substrate-binding protein [Burkholderiaceae bacterium]
MSLIRRLQRLAVLVSVVWLAGCAPPPSAPLVLGIGPWVGYDPFVLAREHRQVDAGRLKIVELATNAEVVRNMRNGLLDAAAVTLDQAMQLAEQGLDLRVVALLDQSAGADAVMALPGLDEPARLKGGAILVEPSTVGNLMLRAVLAAGGLDNDDVRVVALDPSQHLAMINAGKAVAAVSYEPWATQLRQGGLVAAFDSRALPGQIVDVLVVRAELMDRRGADVDAMLMAWERGLDRLQHDTVAAADLLAPSLDMTSREYQDTLSGLQFMHLADSAQRMVGTEPVVRRDGAALAASLQAMGELTRAPDWERLMDASVVERVVREAHQP